MIHVRSVRISIHAVDERRTFCWFSFIETASEFTNCLIFALKCFIFAIFLLLNSFVPVHYENESNATFAFSRYFISFVHRLSFEYLHNEDAYTHPNDTHYITVYSICGAHHFAMCAHNGHINWHCRCLCLDRPTNDKLNCMKLKQKMLKRQREI